MLKKYLTPIMVIGMLLVVTVSPSDAVPGNDIEFGVPPFYQFGMSWGALSGWECELYAAKGKLQNCTTKNHPNTIWEKGCAITSLTMLYWYHGMEWMFDPVNHLPKMWDPPLPPVYLHPGRLDDWLVDNGGYFKTKSGGAFLDWNAAVEKFYYYDWPLSDFYKSLMPNYYCDESIWNKNLACSRVDWSPSIKDPLLPTAEQLLDNDLRYARPNIMKISRPKSNGEMGDHFVVAAGYSTQYASYSVYDPGKYDNSNLLRPRALAKLYPKGGVKYLKIYRFRDWISRKLPIVSKLEILLFSPVEIQIIDPKGRKTGHDPATGEKLQENPMSLYDEEKPAPSSKYGANSVSADIDGDGYDEIIVGLGPDPKNAATFRVYRRNGTQIAEYTAFDAKYGLTLASADLDGDWIDELIVGTGPDPKNPGTLKVLKSNGTGFVEVMTRTIYPDAKKGINIAAGDIDGDGKPEIITAAGPGEYNPATVTVWKYDAAGLNELSTFTAFEGTYGATITAGDTDGDGMAEIVAGSGPDPKNPSVVRIYRADGTMINEFMPYSSKHGYGVTVTAADMDGDGADEIISGSGPGSQNEPQVKVFKAVGAEISSFLAYPHDWGYGVKVNAGRVGQ